MSLKDVYKTDVYRLANYRNRLEDNPVIPERVITRPPSAELRPNQKDQDSLGDYDTLDSILKCILMTIWAIRQLWRQDLNQNCRKIPRHGGSC